MCGVPYGTVDVDRLLAIADPGRDRARPLRGRRAGEGRERARVAALRQVPDVPERVLAPRGPLGHLHVQAGGAGRGARAAASPSQAIAEATDDGLMELLITRDGNALAAAIRARRLYKRALDLPASDVPEDAGALDRGRSGPAGAGRGRASPARSGWPRASCCSTSRPARRCSASTCRSAPAAATVERLTDAGRAGQLGLPRVADELYRSARRLRVFVGGHAGRPLRGVPALLTCPAAELRQRLDAGSPIAREENRSMITRRTLRRPGRRLRARRASARVACWAQRASSAHRHHRLQERHLRLLRQVGGLPAGPTGSRRPCTTRRTWTPSRTRWACRRAFAPATPRSWTGTWSRATCRPPTSAGCSRSGRRSRASRYRECREHAGHGGAGRRRTSRTRSLAFARDGKTTVFARH